MSIMEVVEPSAIHNNHKLRKYISYTIEYGTKTLFEKNNHRTIFRYRRTFKEKNKLKTFIITCYENLHIPISINIYTKNQ